MTIIDFILFWHGLSLLLISAAMFISRRSFAGSSRKQLVSVFCLLLGAGEWVAVFSSFYNGMPWLYAVRVLLFSSAFLLLFENVRKEWACPGRLLAVYPVLIFFMAAGYHYKMPLLLLCQYLLAVPSILFFAITLVKKRSTMKTGGLNFAISVSVSLLYGILWMVPVPDLLMRHLPLFLSSWGGIISAASVARALCMTTGLGAMFIMRFRSFFGDSQAAFRWCLPAVYIAVLACSLAGVIFAGRIIEKEMKTDILSVVRGISTGLNSDRVKQLAFTPADRNNPAFQRIREQMTAWGNFTGLRSIYSMKMVNGRFFFGPENIPENDPMASPPGTEYMQPDASFKNAWINGESGITGPYTDEYGVFVSAYAPVFDRMSGQLLMLVGIDCEAWLWKENRRRGEALVLLPGMVLSICLIMFMIAFDSRHRKSSGRSSFFYRNLEILFSFVIGFLITSILALCMDFFESRGFRREFRNFSDSWSNIIRSVIINSRNNSDELSRYIRNSVEVTWKEYRDFYNDKDILPTVSISWFSAVEPAERSRFERYMVSQGFDNFRIFRVRDDGSRDYNVNGDIFFPQAYTVPYEYSMGLYGMDISTVPDVNRMGKSGLTFFTSIQALNGLQHGRMTLVEPVYKKKLLAGLVVSVIDINLMFTRAIAYKNSMNSDIFVELVDISIDGKYRSMASYPPEKSSGQMTDIGVNPAYPLFFAGRTFGIIIRPSGGFIESQMAVAGPLTFSGGLIITLIIAGLAGYFRYRERGLEKVIFERTGELAESEERFRTLSEGSTGGICIHDRGRIIICNSGLSHMTRYTIKELEGMNGLLLIAPQYRDMVMEKIITGYEMSYDSVMLRKDGTMFPVEIRGRGIPYKGRIMRITEFRDITERKNNEIMLSSQKQELEASYEEMQAQIEEFEAVNAELLNTNERLSDSEEKFSRAFAINPAMMIISTIDTGTFIDVNDIFLETTGYTKEQVIGKTSRDIELFVDHAQRDIAVDYLVRHGVVRNYEVIIKTSSGGMRHGLFSADKIRIRENDYLLSVMNDITDRKGYELALKESEKKYRMLFEFSLDPVLILDGESFIDCNEMAMKMFRCGREDIIGASPFAFSPEFQPDGMLSIDKARIMIRSAYDGGGYTFPWTHMGKDGTLFEAEVSLGSFILEDKKLIIAIIRDVTERKRYEAKLSHMQKMDAVGQMAGGIAHDFNNQLGGIMGYAELLSKKLEDPGLRKYADNIISVASRSADLTRKLLQFSRKGSMRTVQCDVHRIINDTIEILEHSIDKRISIVRSLDAEEHLVTGDPAELQNVFLNLALNARDAMESGGVLSFTTSVENVHPVDFANHLMNVKHGRYIRITVADTGTGMSDEVRAHLFEPFFTTKAEGRGTGMGLASVYAGVKNHAGSISVESEPGNGTSFKIYLPPASATEVVPESGSGHRPSITPQRILIVDDEDILREILGELLMEDGHTVTSVSNGFDAVEMYKKNWEEIDLVILDMVMPGLNGRDTFAEMKKINAGVKVILSSGFSMTDETDKMLREGIAGFIHKPFQKNELLRIISIAVNPPL